MGCNRRILGAIIKTPSYVKRLSPKVPVPPCTVHERTHVDDSYRDPAARVPSDTSTARDIIFLLYSKWQVAFVGAVIDRVFASSLMRGPIRSNCEICTIHLNIIVRAAMYYHY